MKFEYNVKVEIKGVESHNGVLENVIKDTIQKEIAKEIIYGLFYRGIINTTPEGFECSIVAKQINEGSK